MPRFSILPVVVLGTAAFIVQLTVVVTPMLAPSPGDRFSGDDFSFFKDRCRSRNSLTVVAERTRES